MVDKKSHKKKKAENLRKARAKRFGIRIPPEKYVPIRRELSPIKESQDEPSSQIIENEILFTDDQSSESSASNQSDDEYQEHQSNLFMSLNSLRAIIRHLVCKRCKGANGDMWPSVTNIKGFKVQITVACKCGYSFVHETFENLDVNEAVIRCLIANGISLEAFQRFLIVMGFSYWSEQRNRYLSINLTSSTFDSQKENQAIICAADASEKKHLKRAARQSSATVSFDGTYKTAGFNSRSCFGALLVGKKVVASDIVKKEMRPTFKGTCYGIMKSITSHAMEVFIVELLLKRINPIIGSKIKFIDTDGDARIPKVIPKIQWETQDSHDINPITDQTYCNVQDVGSSIWNDEKGPELRSDKVCNRFKTLS